MTAQEAIEAIKHNKPTSGYYILREALDMAIKALEKQIPKNPIKHMANPVGFPYYKCPVCGAFDVSGQG